MNLFACSFYVGNKLDGWEYFSMCVVWQKLFTCRLELPPPLHPSHSAQRHLSTHKPAERKFCFQPVSHAYKLGKWTLMSERETCPQGQNPALKHFTLNVSWVLYINLVIYQIYMIRSATVLKSRLYHLCNKTVSTCKFSGFEASACSNRV